MKRIAKMMVMGALLGVSAIAAPVSADETCGEKGQKPCPMQGWMEDNVQVPMEDGDYKKVVAALKKVADMAPDKKWNEGDKSWAEMTKEGIKAAEAEDLKALKKSCKSCHKAFRKEYKAKYRMRPVKG